MNPEELQELKQKIEEAIEAQKILIASLTETSKPKHAMDNLAGGLGRLPDEKTRDRMRKVIQDFA